MPDSGDVTDLLRQSQFVFEATVQQHQRSTVPDIPVGSHTVVVKIDRVLQGPPALSRAAGSEATVQLLEREPVPAAGEQMVLFTSAIAFGPGIAL